MRYLETLAHLGWDAGAPAPVHVSEAAAVLRLAPPAPEERAEPAPDGVAPGPGSASAYHVHATVAADVAVGVATLASSLGPDEVGLLYVRSAPDALPVGEIVTALSDAGLWCVLCTPSTAPHSQVAIGVSADPDRPVGSYLFGGAVPASGVAARRLRNEWLVEGLTLRARSARLERSLEAAREEAAVMKSERDASLRARIVAETTAAELRERLDAFDVVGRLRKGPAGKVLSKGKRAARRVLP